jgi:hypothetical protein
MCLLGSYYNYGALLATKHAPTVYFTNQKTEQHDEVLKSLCVSSQDKLYKPIVSKALVLKKWK